MQSDMMSKLGELRGSLKIQPDTVSSEVIYGAPESEPATEDDGRDSLSEIFNTDGLQVALEGDPYFARITDGGFIMNFKDRRVARTRQTDVPLNAQQTQPIGLSTIAKIKTEAGDEMEIRLSPQQHNEFVQSRIDAQRSSRWANNAHTAFVVAGTVLMAFGIAMGIRKETRNQP